MENKKIILDFIEQFRALGAENCFSNGMCWYFSVILRFRFGWHNEVMYDTIANHFATKIDGRIYDISGDITDDENYHWISWKKYKNIDPIHALRIKRDCIWKK